MNTQEDDVLEKNVETLLDTGGDAPRLADLSRARIRAALVAQHARTAKRSPLVAVGIGVAAAAAGALILTRVIGGTAEQPHDAIATLADGTTWIADTGAHVTQLGPRHLRVEGAALLDVAPGKGTFVVETARGRIEVLGTKFLVAADATRTTAAVVRGQVKLATDQGDVLLHAGEQGVAEAGRPPSRGPAPRLSHLVSWAAAARHKEEHDIVPIHHGTLFAKDPGIRSHPPWGDEYPLPMKELKVDVVVDDQVARVALDQTFHNDENQALEGTYRFAIPADAALQRLAMYVDGKLEESAVVERMQARRIYEELVYRRVDPALLEWAGTGRLSLRVYPIPAREDKRLMLGYTQSLPKLYDDWTLTVPLPELDQPVGQLSFAVRVKGCANCELSSPSHAVTVGHDGDDAILTYQKTGERLGDSLVVHVRDTRHAATVASHHDADGTYLMVRAPSDLRAAAHPYHQRSWVIVDDVSASRGAMERRAQADLVDAFVRELDEDDKVAVVAFDVAARTKLAPTRVLDVDRVALHTALKAEGGVGATDFGVALDAATKLLAGTQPDDAMIVYLGDGVITSGPRHLDELRAKVANVAHFVGVGVGDGPDTQTLESLAAATGGYATTLDLADDIGWRAFDLVAALHTARVTDLDARLVDASGGLVPSTTYVKSAQLADGEELELVTKLAGTGTPVAVELTGKLDGAPWQRRIALDGKPQEGGYLPRLWAQRHIAARLLAKHEAVELPPCATKVCPSEAELREARDEGIRKEIIGLGKKYFLLSRHTSLLVLENDAMYAQYGVTKGAGDTWAPYAMPKQIAVVTAPYVTVPSTVATDAELVRSPVPVFYDYGNYINLQQNTWGMNNPLGEFEFGANGVGRFGTIGHGAGGGGGYGFGGGRGGMRSRVSLGITTSPGPITLTPVASAAAVEPTQETTRAQPDADAKVDKAYQSAFHEMALDEGVMGKTARLQDVVSTRDLALSDARSAGFLGSRWMGGKGYFGWNGQPLAPQRFVYPADVSFDDVSALVPALVHDGFDAWRAELSGDPKPHAIDDAARTLLAKSRAQLPSGIYRWDDFEIAIDSARRIGWRRTTEYGLRETASYDGTTWTRRYPELGLDATRAVGEDDIALELAYVPMLVADPAHWAHWFDVRAAGPHRIALQLGKRVIYTLDFDNQDRLVAMTDADGRKLIELTWSATGPTAARMFGTEITASFAGEAITDAAAWAHDAPAQAVVVELPGHLVAYNDAKVKALAVGSAAWRAAERQLMVSLAATNDLVRLLAEYQALRTHGGVELGDLALASGGLGAVASDKDVTAALSAFQLPQLSRNLELPLVRYLATSHAYSGTQKIARSEREHEPGMIGALWTLREATALFAANQSKAAIEKLLTIDERAIELRLIGAAVAAQHYEASATDLGRVWDAAAIGVYKNVARSQAALAMFNRGAIEAGTERTAALVADLDLHALPPHLDNIGYYFQQSRRGAAGWQIVWASWRTRVLAGDSYEHVIALLGGVQLHPSDAQEILARAVELSGDDVTRRIAVAQAAVGYNLGAWAQAVIAPLLASHPTHDLYQLAAQLALAQGRTAEALGDLESAQDVAASEPVNIATVRGELGQILAVARQLAVQSSGTTRQQAVARAMAWGDRWRAIDAGNPAIDEQLGELQLAVGNPTEAWRQLSTVIERDPMSGDGYQTVAQAFENQGRVAEALDFWQQAIVIDQTNPTPRLRKAQALIALGRNAEGDAILHDIAGRTWHDAWMGVVYQAKDLLERGKQVR